MLVFSSIETVLGKRPRDDDDETQDFSPHTLVSKRICLPAPRRRSSPPGAFPGSDPYCPVENPIADSDLATVAPIDTIIQAPVGFKDVPTSINFVRTSRPAQRVAKKSIFSNKHPFRSLFRESAPANTLVAPLQSDLARTYKPCVLNHPSTSFTSANHARTRNATAQSKAHESLPSSSPLPESSIKKVSGTVRHEDHPTETEIKVQHMKCLQRAAKHNVFSRLQLQQLGSETVNQIPRQEKSKLVTKAPAKIHLIVRENKIIEEPTPFDDRASSSSSQISAVSEISTSPKEIDADLDNHSTTNLDSTENGDASVLSHDGTSSANHSDASIFSNSNASTASSSFSTLTHIDDSVQKLAELKQNVSNTSITPSIERNKATTKANTSPTSTQPQLNHDPQSRETTDDRKEVKVQPLQVQEQIYPQCFYSTKPVKPDWLMHISQTMVLKEETINILKLDEKQYRWRINNCPSQAHLGHTSDRFSTPSFYPGEKEAQPCVENSNNHTCGPSSPIEPTKEVRCDFQDSSSPMEGVEQTNSHRVAPLAQELAAIRARKEQIPVLHEPAPTCVVPLQQELADSQRRSGQDLSFSKPASIRVVPLQEQLDNPRRHNTSNPFLIQSASNLSDRVPLRRIDARQMERYLDDIIHSRGRNASRSNATVTAGRSAVVRKPAPPTSTRMDGGVTTPRPIVRSVGHRQQDHVEEML